MEDSQIIDLYFQRDETAITETDKKYGGLCRSIALNILTSHADAEECISDTYLKAWDSIPPLYPQSFAAWLGRVVRNNAINLWNKNHRQKRHSDMTKLLNELEDCLPSPINVEQILEGEELSNTLNKWLGCLQKNDRVLFVLRYWYGKTVKDLAKSQGTTPRKLAKHLYNLRQNLKQFLEKEGYSL